MSQANSQPIPEIFPVQCSETECSTLMKLTKCCFKWTIHNFRIRPEVNGECICSSEFNSGDISWCLQLYPKGESESSEGNLSIFLKLMSLEKSIQAKYILSILNAKREKKVKKECGVWTFDRESPSWGFKKAFEYDFILDQTNELLPDDKLTLCCEITSYADSVIINGPKYGIPIKVPECHLPENLGKLLECKEFVDVVLCINGQELFAHKNILSACSPVFAAMFRNDMKETQQNRVEIIDVDHEIMREVLQFIYTGKAPRLYEIACDLLAAADKYALDNLKLMCEEAMRSNLTVDNVYDVLSLADTHNACELKACAIDFITAHTTEVMKTDSWKTMFSCQPDLAKEVCDSIATKLSYTQIE